MKKSSNSVPLTITLVGVFVFSSICIAGPVMVEKNLFAQDRRPPSPNAAPSAPQSNAPGLAIQSIQLDGVFIHGDSKKALVRYKGGGAPGKEKRKNKQASPFTTVQEGERLGDYLVKEIEPRRISLEKDGQTVVVSLFAEGKVVPPAPPMPVAPGAGGNRQRGAVPGQPGQPGQREARGNEHPGGLPPGVARGTAPDEQMQADQDAENVDVDGAEEEMIEEEELQ